MPELPEVEVTCRGIAPSLLGCRITKADFRVAALRYPLPLAQTGEFLGQRVSALYRRGKYLVCSLQSGHLLIHLGMSGSLRLVAPGTPPAVHDHVDLEFAAPHAAVRLRLRDPRRFGALLWIAGDAAALARHPLLAVLGIEPLDAAFTGAWLACALAGLRIPIKPALMDSHRVVGIGNIYASESLFHAGIDPRRAAGRIARQRLDALAGHIRQTLERAIAAGGSSVRDFIQSDGSSGYFQQTHCVYGRTGEPCRICATPVREVRQTGRATYWCPRCQR